MENESTKAGGTELEDRRAELKRLLRDHGIRYLCEHPVAVREGSKTHIWYPDCHLSDYGLIIDCATQTEEDPRRREWKRKQAVYDANGVSALMLTQYDLRARNWPDYVLDLIEGMLVARVDSFLASRFLATDPTESCLMARNPLQSFDSQTQKIRSPRRE